MSGDRLQEAVEGADLARVQHERLAEEILITVAKQSDLASRRSRRQERRRRHRLFALLLYFPLNNG